MDFNLLAGAMRGVNRITPTDPRSAVAGMRVGVSVQALLPVIEGQAASTQFAKDVRGLLAEAARGLTTVFVVQPPGSSQMRIEVDRQFLTVPATLRDAVMTLVQAQRSGAAAENAAAPQTAATPAQGANPAAGLPQTAPALPSTLTGTQALLMQMHVANVGAALSAHNAHDRSLRKSVEAAGASAATLKTDTVLLDSAQSSSESAARRLRSAVEQSGLFFESHLAQWSAGERSAEDMRAELARLQQKLLSLVTHDESGPRINAAHLNAATLSGERVAAQLDVLQKSALVVQAQAWPGQSCSVQLREELAPEHQASAGARSEHARVVSATLVLDLPALGPVEVEIKLAGHAVAVQARAGETSPQGKDDHAARWGSALRDLGSALQARGLEPVALSAQPWPKPKAQAA